MMEVLDTQTLQATSGWCGCRASCSRPAMRASRLPEDHGVLAGAGSAEAGALVRRNPPQGRGVELLRARHRLPRARDELGAGYPRTLEQTAVGADFDPVAWTASSTPSARPRRKCSARKACAPACTTMSARGSRPRTRSSGPSPRSLPSCSAPRSTSGTSRGRGSTPCDAAAACRPAGRPPHQGSRPHRRRGQPRRTDVLSLSVGCRNLPRARARRPGSRRDPRGSAPDWPGWLIIEVDRASMDPVSSAAASWAWSETRLHRDLAGHGVDADSTR